MEKSTKLPYGSYKTFRNYRDQLKQDGIPGRIDSSVMRNLSGATQIQLRGTLRYLNLIDDDNIPQEGLVKLVYAEDEEKAQLLTAIIADSYGFLFANEDGVIDLSKETPMTFHSKFREIGLTGDTVRKAEAFFINLATEAGIIVPKRLMSGRTAGDRPQKSSPRIPKTRPNESSRTATPTRNENRVQQSPQSDPETQWRQKMLETLIQNLSAKYPEFQPEWDVETQQKWFDGWERLVGLIKEQIDQEGEENEVEN